jgi:hypothetical protein
VPAAAPPPVSPLAAVVQQLEALSQDETTTPAARAAPVLAFLQDPAQVQAAALAVAHDPAQHESLLLRLGGTRGGAALAASVRKSLKDPIRQHAARLKQEAAQAAAEARAKELDGEGAEAPDPNVWRRLDHTDADPPYPKPSQLNVYKILAHDPRMRGRIAYNAFTCQHLFDGEPMTDEAETALANWVARVYRCNVVTKVVAEQYRLVASEREFHPVRDYLLGLEGAWDGHERISYLFADHFGAEDTELNRKLSRCFMIALVARIMQPGCKVDTVVVFVGRGGAKKSQCLKALAVQPEWFCDTPLDLASKDRFELIQGVWLYELQEFDQYRGADQARLKAMLSSQKDKWRGAYRRNVVEVERQVVPVGTTNQDEILADETGTRRLQPVRIGRHDLVPAALAAVVDQLYAEAMVAYRNNERWWLEREDEDRLAVASQPFQVSDAWDEVVFAWIYADGEGPKEGFTVAQVLRYAVQKPDAQLTNQDAQRVGKILRRKGWVKDRETTGGRLVRWFSTEDTRLEFQRGDREPWCPPYRAPQDGQDAPGGGWSRPGRPSGYVGD